MGATKRQTEMALQAVDELESSIAEIDRLRAERNELAEALRGLMLAARSVRNDAVDGDPLMRTSADIADIEELDLTLSQARAALKKAGAR